SCAAVPVAGRALPAAPETPGLRIRSRGGPGPPHPRIRGSTMAEITASMVKELRERTGAGMMECKKALTENNGDIDAAAEALRKSGLAKADKKASRVAAEGRIATAQSGGRAV